MSKFSNEKVYKILSIFLFSSIATLVFPVNAQPKACVLTSTGQKVCGNLLKSDNSNNNPINVLPAAVMLHDPQTEDDVSLKPIKCIRKSITVNCKFSAITTRDRSLSFYANANGLATVATDSEAREYIATFVTIVNQREPAGFAVRFTKNQPQIVTFSFEVPTGVNSFKSLSFSVMMTQPKTAYFSNFNISQ
jgi:hypothetical protein